MFPRDLKSHRLYKGLIIIHRGTSLVKILNNFQGFTRKTLQQMVDKKWVTLDGAMWSMTSLGYEEAENLYSQT